MLLNFSAAASLVLCCALSPFLHGLILFASTLRHRAVYCTSDPRFVHVHTFVHNLGYFVPHILPKTESIPNYRHTPQSRYIQGTSLPPCMLFPVRRYSLPRLPRVDLRVILVLEDVLFLVWGYPLSLAACRRSALSDLCAYMCATAMWGGVWIQVLGACPVQTLVRHVYNMVWACSRRLYNVSKRRALYSRHAWALAPVVQCFLIFPSAGACIFAFFS